jgi:hypothetical protein
VRWYLRYWLSFRDVEELPTERGLEADHLALRSALRSRTGTALRRQAIDSVPDSLDTCSLMSYLDVSLWEKVLNPTGGLNTRSFDRSRLSQAVCGNLRSIALAGLMTVLPAPIGAFAQL